MTDFSPDYDAVIRTRIERLARLRANPDALPAVRERYRLDPATFIDHFGVTVDPRSIAKGKAALVPFQLFPRQRELINWLVERWRNGEPGTVVKSRDVGASWCAMALLGTLAIFERNFAAGIASATEVKLDRHGDPDTLFEKLRQFLRNLPEEFRGGYVEDKHGAYMRITIPETNSSVTGEAGDSAGRGSRKSLYIVDESSHFLHPRLIDAALSATTDTRIDISSVNGTANSFYDRAHNPAIPRFDFTWRDDPRKSPEWYARQVATLDPIIVAAEIDCNFAASTEGQLIPAAHVHSAIGAAELLGLGAPSGAKRAGFDPADEGKDRSALAIRHGSALVHLESWSGKGSDIFKSTQRVLGTCDAHGVGALDVDMDGLGAGVRGDAAALNEKRRAAGKREIEVNSYRGSGGPFDLDGSLLEGVTNRDAFLNMKAMTSWALKLRFEYTHQVVEAAKRGEPIEYDPADLITIDPNIAERNQLITELSQPVYSYTAAGKRQIDKAPDGLKSPNLFDAVAICFSPFQQGAYFSGVRTAAADSSERDAPGMPGALDYVFAVTSFVGDAAAVVYVGANRLDAAGQPCGRGRGHESWILDWDLRELGAAADAWISEIAARADELQRAVVPTPVRAAPVLCDDFDEGWAEMLRQRGFPAKPVGKDLPPITERFGKAKPYVRIGGLIKHAEPAERRMVSFRGSTRNFLRELASSTQVIESNPLAIAYATAILTIYWGRPVVPHPADVVQAPARPGPWRGFRV